MESSSSRLRLREFGRGDVEPVLQIYGDPVATEHLSFEPRDRAGVNRFLDTVIGAAEMRPRSEYTVAVLRLDSSELVGVGRLATEAHEAATIGFALRPDQWRQGLGTELVDLLLKLGFETLELHRVWAAHSPLNQSARAVLQRTGFTEEGRIRHHIRKAGRWRDSITWSILDSEWRDRSSLVGCGG